MRSSRDLRHLHGVGRDDLRLVGDTCLSRVAAGGQVAESVSNGTKCWLLETELDPLGGIQLWAKAHRSLQVSVCM